MRAVSVVIFLALLVGLAPAGEPEAPDAAAITERGHSLEYILGRLIAGGPGSTPRTVVLLVDPTPSLVRARFVEVLQATLEARARPGLRLGLAVVGDRKHPRVAPGEDRELLLGALREALREPESAVRNVHAPLRALIRRLNEVEGAREIVLVTLENGDGEDELERTVSRLERSGVVLHVIGRPALLADSYWVRHRAAWARSGKPPPAGLDLRGQDAAYDDLPWGWLLQKPSCVTELVPSGFGFYGLSRLVALSGGRYDLFYPASHRSYDRCHLGRCPICDGEHHDCGLHYRTHLLAEIAPPLASRVEVRKTLARDPVFSALLEVWSDAADAHLVCSRPALRRGPGLLREESRRLGSWGGLLSKPGFSDVSRRAKKLGDLCGRLAKRLETALAETDPEATTERSVALARTTHAYLLLTRLNLRLLRTYCDRAVRAQKDPGEDVVTPELPPLESRPVSGRSIAYDVVGFCHGVEAISEFEIPGLEEAGAAREEAFAAVTRLRSRYAGTPFGRVARLMGVAVFRLAQPGEAAESTVERHPRGAAGGRTGGGTVTGGR